MLYATERQYNGGSRGGGPGGLHPPPSPLFLDQTEARRAEKKSFETTSPTLVRVWMTVPPSLSEDLDPPLK